nr:sigma-54-dependent Fis family transcriptional regulator [Oceanococcus sp. HetDA_MAG_MS8]
MSELPANSRHARAVMEVLGGNPHTTTDHDLPVVKSWQRCAAEFDLRPDHHSDPDILESHRLRERVERLDDLVAVGRAEMDSLYEQIASSGYALLLTDHTGVILSHKGDPTLDREFAHAGLRLGANWSEEYEGTNGIGTCISEQQPVTIHLADHYISRHIGLTCSAAPIRDTDGDLLGVLDASCLGCHDSKASRAHTVALLNMSARLIEKSLFQRRYSDHSIVRFHSRPEFVNLLHDGAIAVDDSGRIAAADKMAAALLALDNPDDLIGRDLCDVLDLGTHRSGEFLEDAGRKAILPLRSLRHGRRYFAFVHPAQKTMSQLSQPSLAAPSQKVITIEPAAQDTGRYQSLQELAGNDPAMARNLRCGQRIARSRVFVLIQGPTGSGKEAFARALHLASDRADKPFVAVNCAAIPESLIESELFGYKAGAFTGARREGMRGRIQQASGGTLFLDEIGDMPMLLQTRLLRVLEEQEVTPLGGEQTINVDLRVISASHRNLRDMIERGEFREDLYYRLNGITMQLPSLHERADLERLIRQALALETAEGRPAGIELSAMERLKQYHWPGNIRELRNVIRTALAISEGGVIRLDDLPQDVLYSRASAAPASPSLPSANLPHHGNGMPIEDETALEAAEREALLRTIEANRWNMTNAAKQLQMSRNTLYRKLKRHGISPESLREDSLYQR